MEHRLMDCKPERRYRRSIRLPAYDYASPGAYFATICTYKRECIFGVQELRDVVEETWRQIAFHLPNARTDELVIMPNHVHGILWILKTKVGAQHAAPLRPTRAPAVEPRSLGAIVRSFKSAAAKRINEIRRTPGAPVWQRNYYERVIRSEDELNRIREYTHLNPLQWEFDRENPHRVASHEYQREWSWLEGNERGAAPIGRGAACCAPTFNTRENRR
ncbi:MAG: transposase [Chloroflexota bacterium]|nr:transposase [Chloroflexota bacterium]